MKTPGLESFVQELDAERQRQIERFGDQIHPAMRVDTRQWFRRQAESWMYINDSGLTQGWTGILLEEVYEALAEEDPARIRAELIQVAAVVAAWVYDLDRYPASS